LENIRVCFGKNFHVCFRKTFQSALENIRVCFGKTFTSPTLAPARTLPN
jgi:hypothetical protein